jgi:hypothetical protein
MVDSINLKQNRECQDLADSTEMEHRLNIRIRYQCWMYCVYYL